MISRARAALVPIGSLILFAVLAGYMLLVVPVGEGPDEYGHLAYAIHLSEVGLPDPAEDAVDMDHHPPLYYALGALAIRAAGRVEVDPAAPPPTAFDAVSRLPGPYRTTTQYLRVAGRDDPLPHPMYAVRAVSLLFGLLLLAGLWLGARSALAPSRGAVLAAVGWAFLPGVVFSAAVAGNDIAVAAVTTLIYALYVRALTGGFMTRPSHGVLLGLLLGAAAMIKASGLLPTLLLPLVVALAAFRPRRPAVVVSGLIAAGVFLLLLAGGWFYLANLARQGDMVLTGFLVADKPELALPFAVDENYVGHVAARLVRGYLGDLGRQEISLARPLLLLFLALGGVALGGVVLLLRDAWRRLRPAARAEPSDVAEPLGEQPFTLADYPGDAFRDEPPGQPQGRVLDAADAEPVEVPATPGLDPRVLVFCLAAVGLTFALLLRWNLLFYGPYGRYLHVVILPVSLLGSAGARRLVGPAGFRLLVPVLALAPLLAAVYTLFFSVLPHYHTPWSKWTRGEVIHYDDAGHPRAEPHLARDGGAGADFEPWGSYSSARVPSMNVAWGLPELKFRYQGLDPRLPYQVRVTYYGGRDAGKFGLVPYQDLWAGPFRLHGPIPLTFRPRELSYPLPAGAVDAAGGLELRFVGRDGGVAAVAEVWIEKAWLTPKDAVLKPPEVRPGQRVQASLALGNRDPAAEHLPEVYLFLTAPDGARRALAGCPASHPVPSGELWQGGIAARVPADAAGQALELGVRRIDRGPWCILKGGNRLGAAGQKRGDLGARDLHVAERVPGRGGAVLRGVLEAVGAGSVRVAIRYRSQAVGAVVLRGSDGGESGRIPLEATGGAWRETMRGLRGLAAAPTVLEVVFTAPGAAAVDEVQLWAESSRQSFHLYPLGRVR